MVSSTPGQFFNGWAWGASCMSGSGDRAAWKAEKTRYQHIQVDIVAVGAVCGTLGAPNYVPDLLRTQQDQWECLHGARSNGADSFFKSLQNEGFEK